MTDQENKRFKDLGISIISEATEDLLEWFKINGVGAVLLRPDRYILGAAVIPSDLNDLFEFFNT
jgi:hypothetical protein